MYMPPKSTIRAMMMTQEYENPINTIDDVLQSERQFMVAGDTRLRYLLEAEPTTNMKKLQQKVEYFTFGNKEADWMYKG